MREENRLALAQKLEEFKGLPAPGANEWEELTGVPEEVREDLGEIHAELIGYDAFIVGLVVTLTNFGKIDPALLREDKDLMGRIDGLLGAEWPEVRSEAKSYFAYLEQLHDLVLLAKTVAI